jgi:ABC-2 type transport system permease protein
MMRRRVTDAILGLFKSLTRISSFVGKELIEIIRRPGAFFSLVLGPFLVMAIFGLGYSGQRRELRTILVIPPDSRLSRELSEYQQFGAGLEIVSIDEEPTQAEAKLRRQEVDLVVIAPARMEERFRNGEQSEIVVAYNQIDPVLTSYADFLAYRLAKEVNREIITRAVQQGEDYAVQRLGETEYQQIEPEVIASPTRAATRNVAATPPAVLSYFAPAVLALLLQHMAVTLSALSLVRERLSGAIELFRVSPVTTLEILIGKYLGFGLLTMLIGGILVGLVIGVFGVPLIGDPGYLVLVMLLVTFASLGLGLLISVVADSERQAVQLSLLVLLASVFFSGFVLPVEEFQPAVQVGALALPVTVGIRQMQDTMLQGGTYAPWQIPVLAAVGVALFLLTALLLRRNLRGA